MTAGGESLGRHQSFTLSRPGLKPGYYVPARLRAVDTSTIVSSIPAFVALLALVKISFVLARRLDFGDMNPFAFYAYLIAVLVIAAWAISLAMIAVMRFAFLVTGMMTKSESHSFPLDRFDPWPDSWQQPIDKAVETSEKTPPSSAPSKPNR